MERRPRMTREYCVISAGKARFHSAEDAVMQTTIQNVLRKAQVIAKRDRTQKMGRGNSLSIRSSRTFHF